jgi:hypothetical protein
MRALAGLIAKLPSATRTGFLSGRGGPGGKGPVELLRGFRLDPDDQRDPGRGRTVAELLDTVGGRRLQRNSEPQPRNRIFERHISGDLGITPVTAAA